MCDWSARSDCVGFSMSEILRRVIVVSLGSSPSVVTETLWALARRASPFWPDELHIVTTKGSKDLAALADLSAPPPHPMGPRLAALQAELNLAPISVHAHFPQIQGPGGSVREVNDIRHVDEAIAFGDTIGEVVRQITADPRTRLHLSIAGGRKTMSYHAGAAMTLFGRAGDEVSHVLVHPPELEACEDFWWPTKSRQNVRHRFAKDADGAPLLISAHEDDVRIHLVETPFFRARPYLSDDLLDRKVSYERVVQLANLGAGRPKLVIDLAQGTALIGDIDLRLTPSELALYCLFASRARERAPSLGIKYLNIVTHPARIALERFRGALVDNRAALPGKPGRKGAVNSLMTRLSDKINRTLVQPELIARFGLTEPSGDRRGAYAMAAHPDDIVVSFANDELGK